MQMNIESYVSLGNELTISKIGEDLSDGLFHYDANEFYRNYLINDGSDSRKISEKTNQGVTTIEYENGKKMKKL